MILDDIQVAFRRGRFGKIEPLVQQALKDGIAPEVIRDNALKPAAMSCLEIARSDALFEAEFMAASIYYKKAMSILNPLINPEDSVSQGSVCVTYAYGVGPVLGRGIFEGTLRFNDVEVVVGLFQDPSDLIQLAMVNNCSLIAMSAGIDYLSHDVRHPIGLYLPRLMDLLEVKGLRDKIQVMIFGGGVDSEFCAKMRADAYSGDWHTAADVALELLKAKHSHD